MVEFLNEEVRKEFHLLPLERQKYFMDFGQDLFYRGQKLTVLFVDHITTVESEITVRIVEKGD